MKNGRSVPVVAVISIALVLSVPLWAALQEKKTDKAAAAAPAMPGAAEMERLKFYLGEWDYTETYPKSAFAPNGGKNTGVYTSKLGPGGQSLINSFHSQGPIGDFEGLTRGNGGPHRPTDHRRGLWRRGFPALSYPIAVHLFVIPAKALGHIHISSSAAATFFPLPLRAVRPAL